MKKFLSLVLALVMTMSLVTVSAGAKDFTDNDAITYDEAVAVVSEVGIVDGYADGDFKPTNTLTRQAAAKIICNLILGPTTAAELHADTAPYPDVPTTSEFAGYIAFCQSRKIISGYADGTFKPGNTLTGYAFMKMLLGALGYDATLENYTGANWSINVAKQALHIGLNKGLTEDFNGLKAVNREEACLYAFNTLQADLVEYGQRLTTNINGTEVTLSAGGAESRKWTSQKSRNDNIVHDDIIQFAEEYFNKLVKQDDWTVFMEPAYTWLYDKTEIGTYERVDLLVETYTGEVTGRDMYDQLKSSVIRDNDLEVYIDGYDALGSGTVTLGGDKYNEFDKEDLVRSNTKGLGATDDGVVTKVYLDTDKDLITIVSIHTWLAQATADYSESREYAPLSVYVGKSDLTRGYNVDVEDVANVVDVKDEEYYLVNISWKNNDTNGELVRINDVEILEDATVTKFSAGNDGDGTDRVTKLTTGGTEYKANTKAFYAKEVLNEYDQTLLTDNTYNVFLDANGFFIGVELFEGTKNYVFVTGFDRNTSNLSVKTATAAGIFLDGTMKTMEVNVTDTDKNIDKAVKIGDHNAAYFQKWSDTSWQDDSRGDNGVYDLNQWYTYTVDEGGVYTLKPCVRMTVTGYAKGASNATIRTDALSVQDNVPGGNNTRVYGEDESTFLTVDLDKVDTTGLKKRAITEVTGVYTGVQNVDIDIDVTDSEAIRQRQVFTVYDSDYYVIGAVIIGEARGATANYAYITSYAKSEELRDGTYYWTFDAVLNGEHQTLEARSKYANTITALTKDTVQELRFDGDYVVSIKDLQNSDVYTNFVKNLDGEDVYYIDADGKDFDGKALPSGGDDKATALSLQGRTLYVTEKRTDMGLGLASDAKGVVIQKENGSVKKTNFNDVKSAVAHLADGGVPYDGKIVAVLNSNGTADWVVFVSNRELTTGNKDENQGGGKDYTYNAWVDAFGFAHGVLTYNRPDYVTTAATVKVDFDVCADGKIIDSVAGASLVNDRYTYGAGLGSGAPAPEGSTITLENVKFMPSEVKVQYKVNGTVLTAAEVTANLGAGATPSVVTDKTVSNTTGTVTFTPAATAYATGTNYTYTISGVGIRNGAPALSGTVAVGTVNTAITAGDIYALGTGYVVVDITATPVAPTYAVTKNAGLTADVAAAIDVNGTVAAKTMDKFGVTGATTDTLKVEVSKMTGINPGDQVSFTPTVGTAPLTDAVSYDITVTTTAGTLKFTDVSGAGTAQWLTVNGNVEITGVTAKIHTPKVQSLTTPDVSIAADGRSITITYNTGVGHDNGGTMEAVTKADFTVTGGAAITSVDHTAGDNTMTLYFNTALAAGDTVEAAATIVNAAAASDATTAKTITVAITSGVYSVTVA